MLLFPESGPEKNFLPRERFHSKIRDPTYAQSFPTSSGAWPPLLSRPPWGVGWKSDRVLIMMEKREMSREGSPAGDAVALIWEWPSQHKVQSLQKSE